MFLCAWTNLSASYLFSSPFFSFPVINLFPQCLHHSIRLKSTAILYSFFNYKKSAEYHARIFDEMYYVLDYSR